jgi:CHAT domain-containing protein/tetratricopeptide (TPR) repeat protein
VPRSVKALAFLLLFFPLGASLQKGVPDAMRRYRDGDAAYIAALRTNDDVLGDRLNHEALDAFRDFVESRPGTTREIDSLLLRAQTRMGELEQYYGNDTAAYAHYQRAIALRDNRRELPDSLVFRPAIFCGIIHYGRSDLDSARFYFEWAERIQSAYATPLFESERLYNNMGALLFETGNYRQAKNYFERALAVLSKSHPFYRELFVNYQNNLAALLIRLEDYDAALSVYKELLNYGTQQSEIRNNIGIIRMRQGAPADALVYFRQVYYPENRRAGWCNDMAQAFLDNRQPDSATHYVQLAMELSKKFHGEQPSVDYGQALRIKGDLARMSGNAEAALNACQEALHQFYPSFTGRRNTENPKQFTGLFFYLNLFQTLVSKAEAWHYLYEQKKETAMAEGELAAYQSAFALVDHVSRTYESDEARLFLQKTKYLVHGRPIDIAFKLYRQTGNKNYLESAFALDQQNKASVLSFNEQQERSSGGGDSLWRRERALRAEITRWTLRASKSIDPAEQATASSTIRDREIELGRIQRARAKRHPLATDSLPTVELLQRTMLDKDTRLISWHFSAGRLTSFVLTKDRFEGRQDSLYAEFYKDLASFLQGLRQTGLPPTHIVSDRLYHLLLDPVLGPEKRLLLIPDDELLYLPFEALSLNGHYLVEQHSVQYQLSTALLRRGKGNWSGLATLAMAPFDKNGFSDSHNSFRELPASGAEINGLHGMVMKGQAASKASFLEQASRFPVLHLATHAVANDAHPELSYIAFAPWQKNSSDEYLLYAGEVYDMHLPQNRLLVLSACETGTGSLVRGEGIFSLSRAFAYAGCTNVITSLWKADDEATAHIMKGLHRYLNEGMAPAEALQSAKIDYIADPAVHPRNKLPGYWAHLVYYGDLPAKPVNGWLWWVMLDAGFVLLALLAFRKIRIRKKKSF